MITLMLKHNMLNLLVKLLSGEFVLYMGYWGKRMCFVSIKKKYKSA
jgi:hypothetical protein